MNQRVNSSSSSFAGQPNQCFAQNSNNNNRLPRSSKFNQIHSSSHLTNNNSTFRNKGSFSRVVWAEAPRDLKHLNSNSNINSYSSRLEAVKNNYRP